MTSKKVMANNIETTSDSPAVGNTTDRKSSLLDSNLETSVVIEPQDLRIKTKLKLIINKFCEIGNDHILSPSFNIGLNTKWYFKIKTNHTEGNHDTEYLSIHLFLNYCEELEVRAKYSVSVVDINNELKLTKSCDELEYKISGDGWGYQKFCDKKYLIDRFAELIPGNRLTLLCEIEVIGEQNNCIEDNLLVEFKRIRSSLKDMSDFTFVVNGKEFAAHKTILAVRSPVFAAMFGKNKSKTFVICINDQIDEVIRLRDGQSYDQTIWPDLDQFDQGIIRSNRHFSKRLKFN